MSELENIDIDADATQEVSPVTDLDNTDEEPFTTMDAITGVAIVATIGSAVYGVWTGTKKVKSKISDKLAERKAEKAALAAIENADDNPSEKKEKKEKK